jgi:hypothetical protein
MASIALQQVRSSLLKEREIKIPKTFLFSSANRATRIKSASSSAALTSFFKDSVVPMGILVEISGSGSR